MLPLERRRSNIQIMAEILRLLSSGETGKTEVMYTVKLTHHQTQQYLEWLMDLGLLGSLVKEGRSASYQITRKGLMLLSKIENVQEMLQREEIPAILNAPELPIPEKPHGHILKRVENTY